MKPLWVQAAAGALVGAVVAGLAFVPGRLLGPANHARPLAVPATVEAPAVHMSLPKPKPVVRHVAKKQIVVAPVAQLAAVRPVTPVVSPAPVVHKAKPAVKHVAAKPKPIIPPKRVAHPRQPKETLAPKPAPAAPAPTPAATASATATVTGTLDPTPPAPTQVAAPATTTTTSLPVIPPPPTGGHGHDHDHHGHGHGHNG